MPSTPEPEHLVVIVAEDEPLVRMVASDALIDAGFTVIEAEHAEQALAILQRQARDVHMLFTDIHMPGAIDGLALAHHALAHWPWISLLIASGKATPTQAELPLGSRFLSKPYDTSAMVAHVRNMAVSH